MKRLISYFLLAWCLCYGAAQQNVLGQVEKIVLPGVDSARIYGLKIKEISGLGLPKINQADVVISHTGYSFLYNEKHENAIWVAYELTKEETVKQFDRTDRFKEDPFVLTGSANDKDYAGSGYDRGHLAPAADMGWSEISMAESFYYSNISPQTPSFNRGIWKKLEGLVRTWAIDNNAIYVVTGPVLSDSLPAIGANGVSVPKFYYKVLLDYTEPKAKGIGFILPNETAIRSLASFAVSIDSVEIITGIDFFPGLPDEDEVPIEQTLCLSCWMSENQTIHVTPESIEE